MKDIQVDQNTCQLKLTTKNRKGGKGFRVQTLEKDKCLFVNYCSCHPNIIINETLVHNSLHIPSQRELTNFCITAAEELLIHFTQQV